jgi:hypothetical protein
MMGYQRPVSRVSNALTNERLDGSLCHSRTRKNKRIDTSTFHAIYPLLHLLWLVWKELTSLHLNFLFHAATLRRCRPMPHASPMIANPANMTMLDGSGTGLAPPMVMSSRASAAIT